MFLVARTVSLLEEMERVSPECFKLINGEEMAKGIRFAAKSISQYGVIRMGLREMVEALEVEAVRFERNTHPIDLATCDLCEQSGPEPFAHFCTGKPGLSTNGK